MTIKIVLADGDSGSPAPGLGTRVFSSSGEEINNVSSVDISISPDSVIEARVSIALEPGLEMENIHALLGTSTLEEIARLHGYDLIEKNPVACSTLDSRSVRKFKPQSGEK